jgi:ribose/xylose/arabinose/galactoside ABC-type transport system permease subunit
MKKSFGKLLLKFVRDNAIFIVVLLVIVVTAIMQSSFLTWDNLLNILRQNSMIGIVACGMTYCIIAGLFDLSVGSIVSLSGVIVILAINAGINEFVAVAYGLLAGVAVGVINGTLVSLINGRSGEAFIITYGMQVVVAAIALFPSNGLFISGNVSEGFFKSLGEGATPAVIFVVLTALLQFILVKTRYGRQLCYIGSNINAAKMSGIRVKPNRISYFVISGLMSGIAAVLLCSRVTSSNPTAGLGFETDAIAGIVVGGTSLSGGSGSVVRTALGIIIIGIMSNALNILGITAYHQQIVKGLLIIAAVSMDIWNKRMKVREMSNEKAYIG